MLEIEWGILAHEVSTYLTGLLVPLIGWLFTRHSARHDAPSIAIVAVLGVSLLFAYWGYTDLGQVVIGEHERDDLMSSEIEIGQEWMPTEAQRWQAAMSRFIISLLVGGSAIAVGRYERKEHKQEREETARFLKADQASRDKRRG
jgi:membrane protease YdiL (CAAX protease family)